MLVLSLLFISCYAMEPLSLNVFYLFDSSVFAKSSGVAYAMPRLIRL